MSNELLHEVAGAHLANEVIEQWTCNEPLRAPFAEGQSAVRSFENVSVTSLSDDELLEVSRIRRLSLDLHEMKAIQVYYRDCGREPTDLELEMLAQTWSEHCVHKTFKARVNYCEEDSEGREIKDSRQIVDSMIRTYLKGATDTCGKDFIRSAFVDNAGIVRFDDEFDVAIKAETHNHPSALEPFGGANTGVGGVVRDILGVSARPIANTNVLCFGPQDTDARPSGVLDPKRVMAGVVSGIEDYGNKMGIPTVNGAIYFDPGYLANPLVYAGCVGILPTGTHPTKPEPGDCIVVIGGRTGRDGLRGATFSSMEMDHQTGEIAGTAVQIGHPINEKQVQEVICEARDLRLYSAITDCGAGGLSSSVGEMAAELGADIWLDDIPLKYPGLQPWEVWLSEAQERMVLAVPPKSVDALKKLCDRHQTEGCVIGHFRDDGILNVRHGDVQVGQFDVHFLHNGIPQMRLDAVWRFPTIPPLQTEHLPSESSAVQETLLKLLIHPNLCSRESVVRRYDHEVQGGTAVKPLGGEQGLAPNNGSVIVPQAARFKGRTTRGVALGCGINPAYGKLDPYFMAWAAVDEAIRNVVSVGADPDEISLLDNFCWGNPRLPDRMGALTRCVRGCGDAAKAFFAPYVSGKDSLNNEFTGADGQRYAIPGTLLVTALGIVPNVQHCPQTTVYGDDSILMIIGLTSEGLGGSALEDITGQSLGELPKIETTGLENARGVHRLVKRNLVRSCHDISEGGLSVTLAEMMLDASCGLSVHLDAVPTAMRMTDAEVLFSECLSRYVITVSEADYDEVAELLDGVTFARFGRVIQSQELIIHGQHDYVWSQSQLLEAHHGNPRFMDA